MVAKVDDDANFIRFFRVSYPKLRSALRAAGAGERAEDLAQETMARVLKRWKKVSQGDNPEGYAFVTAFRLLRSSKAVDFSKATTPYSESQSEIEEGKADFESLLALTIDLESALSRLTPQQRTCFVGRCIIGIKTEELADALGIAASTVRKQTSLARRALFADGALTDEATNRLPQTVSADPAALSSDGMPRT